MKNLKVQNEAQEWANKALPGWLRAAKEKLGKKLEELQNKMEEKLTELQNKIPDLTSDRNVCD